MHVIQFPGRSTRAFVAGANSASIRVAVNETASGSHPFLSRGMQNSSRFSRPGSSRSRMAGIDEYRALAAQSPAFLLSHLGGRLVLGEPNNSHLGREENGADGGFSRWTDDGSGSNAGMRALSLCLESSIQSALSSAQQPTADSISVVKPSNSLSSVHVENLVDEAGDSSQHRPSGASSNLGHQENVNAARSSTTLTSSEAGASDGDPGAASNTVQIGNVEGNDNSIIDDRSLDDNDELALALRLSMESGDSMQPLPVNNEGGAELQNVETQHSLSNETNILGGVGGSGAPRNVDSMSGVQSSDSLEAGAIDAAFLAELPDELRAEVIAQQSSQGTTRWAGGGAQLNPGMNFMVLLDVYGLLERWDLTFDLVHRCGRSRRWRN